MPLPFAPFLLALTLLTGAAASAQLRPSPCGQGLQRLELRPEPGGKVHEVCISPWRSTLLSFDSEIDPESVTLEGAERFRKVELGKSMLKVEPSEKALPGERFRLTVLFKDGAAPVSAAFWLVVHPAWAEPLVEVYRRKRTVDSCLQEVTEKGAQLRECREENARLHEDRSGSGGLAALLDSGLMDKEGVATRRIFMTVTRHTGEGLRVLAAYSYRSSKRVAVDLRLVALQEMPAWRIAGAELVGPGRRTLRVLPLRQREPLRFGEGEQRLLIEAEATEEEIQGTFTLKVWDADGIRSAILTGVTFP